MGTNADGIAALCRILLENVPYSEINVAVLVAGHKCQYRDMVAHGELHVPISTYALAALTLIFEELMADYSQQETNRCQS